MHSVDAEILIYQNLRESNCPLAKQLQDAFESENVIEKSKIIGKIICRRMLQLDALRYGWVLINYPCRLNECVQLFEHFKIPPNKFVYLKCSEKMALRRLVAKPNLGRPQDNCEYMQQEMRFYDKYEEDIDEYLARRHEVIYINAEFCAEVVKNDVMARLLKSPYVLGFKQDFR